ncbi:MAG: hypothetical protein CMI17_09295 [Opitutaceae bacterium]|nr:hypothetical protein [Opitutaceae bacterium]
MQINYFCCHSSQGTRRREKVGISQKVRNFDTPEQHKWLHQGLQDFRKTSGERVRTIDTGDSEPELSEVEYE